MPVSVNQLRRLALAMPEAVEQPHHTMCSWRARQRIFATLTADGLALHCFIAGAERDRALTLYGPATEPLLWGAKTVGVRLWLAQATLPMVRELLQQSYDHKLPPENRMTRCHPRRRTLLLAAALGSATGASRAQAYPSKPLRLIVNFPPGGAADVIGRALAQAMGDSLKQQLVVENRPGANGNIGADVVAKSAADGYTLLMSSGGAMTVNPFLYPAMPFDPQRDLVPLASCARVLVFLLAHPSVPAANLREFVSHLKANPGRLSYASAGSGSSPHLAAEMMKRGLGVFAVHVPYRGAAPALTDLLAGQVQFMFDPGPGLRHAREGRLKMLAVGSPRRASAFADVPTLAESGFPGLAGFDADTVFGLYAPGGTPPALVELLHGEANKALALPRVQDPIRALGAEPMIGTRSEFVARQNADRERFGAFIREAKIKAD